MATYKVIQDIEAEDKLLGPLTLKQFIFAGIAAGFLFAGFMVATKINIYMAIPFIPFVIVPAVLAAPIGKDQPTDVWLSAQIRFLFKPHKRIWDQNDIKNLVTITAPKKVEKQYSDNLSQGEVRSRLKVLSDTIDSRGWVLKGIDPSIYNPKIMAMPTSDRLLNPYSNLPATSAENYVASSADIMDEVNNPLAQHFDQMVKTAESDNRQKAIKKMYKKPEFVATEPAEQPIDSTTDKATTNAAITDDSTTDNGQPVSTDDQAILKKIKAQKEQEELQEQMTAPHHKSVKTPEQLAKEEAKKLQAEAQKAEQAQAVTPLKNPDIVNLANADDLSVASIANLANRKKQNSAVEGEIKLH